MQNENTSNVKNKKAVHAGAGKKAEPAQRARKTMREPGVAVMALFAAAFLLVTFLMEYLTPSGGTQTVSSPSAQADSGVIISEVMSANASALTSSKGRYSDWLELYNGGEAAVNLRGWTLIKANELHPLTLPDLMLNPGEYLIVFASGEAQATAGYELHAPWKLTAAGDSLALCDASGTQADAVDVPALEKNESYARTASGEWTITGQYTPGLANTPESYAAILESRAMAEDDIIISEVMVRSGTYARDADGDYCDYIELHNTSDKAVNLRGYALSDSDANLSKWVLPDAEIGAGGYLLVYASGKNRTDGELHTGFKLGEGESVFLANPSGQMVACVTPEAFEADQAWSLAEGGFTAALAPTPGQPNTAEGAAVIDAQLTSGNIYGLYISEIMTSTSETDVSEAGYDWVEIYNSASGTIDLSGVGLSDDANRPRKWQFPTGATIGAGEYKIVLLTGTDGTEGGSYCASFRLSKEGGYSLCLSTPQGALIDRVPVGEQYANISYGRSYSVSGFRYYTDPTPRAANSQAGYAGRAQEAVFSQAGGLYGAGETLTITLSAPQGSTVYYTTDCSDPDQNSAIYTGPLTVSSNTILRTRVYSGDCLPSLITTQSYFFGLNHTMQVVSLVSDPVNLFDYYEGIYEMGPGATGQYAEPPYGSNNKGANFWMDWEKAANVELFSVEGETVLSQGCGLKLQGQFSRAEAQKAFKLIARSEYGDNRFRAALFEDRPYTEYQSFNLRASGQDWDKTRIRDIVQTSLASETDVMYQAAEMCVVYLNGQYWGHYNMRERVNKYSIAQWEGWTSDVEDIDIIKANDTVMHGSDATFQELLKWFESNDVETQEDIDYVAQYVDIDNYLDYVAVQMYVGNPDLLNVKRYRSDSEDGKWRWVLFDTDWGFTTDTNSVRRWLDERGAGSEYKTDNTLFIELMSCDIIEDKFIRRFNDLMVSSWTADKVLQVIDTYYQELLPEIDMQLARWELSRDRFDDQIAFIREYAEERALKMLYYYKTTYEFSNAQMSDYFAEALAVVVPQAIEDIAAKVDASGRSKWLDEWNMSESEYESKLNSLRSYAGQNPADLLETIYKVYEPNDSPKHDLELFEKVLDQAK